MRKAEGADRGGGCHLLHSLAESHSSPVPQKSALVPAHDSSMSNPEHAHTAHISSININNDDDNNNGHINNNNNNNINDNGTFNNNNNYYYYYYYYWNNNNNKKTTNNNKQ